MIVFCPRRIKLATTPVQSGMLVHQTFESSLTSWMNESRSILTLSPEEACMVPEVSKKSWWTERMIGRGRADAEKRRLSVTLLPRSSVSIEIPWAIR